MKKLLHSARARRELRRRARLQLRERPTPVASPADLPCLLQELQIHQIELELQNEELLQAKAEVDAGLEKYTDLYDLAPVGYLSLDERSVVLEANLTGAAMLGVERARLIEREFSGFVSPASRPTLRDFLGRIFARRGRQSCEVALAGMRSGPLWADLQALSAVTERGARKWCRVALIDLTAHRQAAEAQRRADLLAATNRKLEKEIVLRQASETALRLSERHAQQLLEQARTLQLKLRHVSHQIIKVQENQRREISRRLHDEISQLLLGINVQLVIFTKAAKLHPGRVRRTIAPLRRLVEQSIRVVHQFARDLRPAMLDDLGLIPALRSFIDTMPKVKGRRIEFTFFPGVEALDNEKRTVLYRVAQEALTNAAKHAGAHRVRVALMPIPRGVALEVGDNGRAFDTTRLFSPEWGDRLGLIGMRERVEMVGGRLSILSKRGTGTVIRVEVPATSEPLPG